MDEKIEFLRKKTYDGISGKKIRLKKDITIPAGTILELGPTHIEFGCDHYEEIVAFGKDHVGEFFIDEDAIRENADIFEILDPVG